MKKINKKADYTNQQQQQKRSKDKKWRKQDQEFTYQVREHCSCPGIPLELLRTRVWSTEIKAGKNTESQSEEGLTRKKS